MTTLPCSRGKHERCAEVIERYDTARPERWRVVVAVDECECACHGLFTLVESS